MCKAVSSDSGDTDPESCPGEIIPVKTRQSSPQGNWIVWTIGGITILFLILLFANKKII